MNILPIRVSSEDFPNIVQVWGYGPNTIVVRTRDGRQIKITAAHNIKSGINSNYCAEFEEIKEIRVKNDIIEIWANADYKSIDGETIEQCLECAMG